MVKVKEGGLEGGGGNRWDGRDGGGKMDTTVLEQQ